MGPIFESKKNVDKVIIESLAYKLNHSQSWKADGGNTLAVKFICRGGQVRLAGILASLFPYCWLQSTWEVSARGVCWDQHA